MNETKLKKDLADLAQQRKQLAAAQKEAYINVYWSTRHSDESGESETLTPLGPSAHVNLNQRLPSGGWTDGCFHLSDQFEAIASVFLAIYPPNATYRVLLENTPPAKKVVGGEGTRRIDGFEQDLVAKAKGYLAAKIEALEQIALQLNK